MKSIFQTTAVVLLVLASLFGLVLGIKGCMPEVPKDVRLQNARSWANTHGYDPETITCIHRRKRTSKCDVSSPNKDTVQIRCGKRFCSLVVSD